jgi:hypothetical protein
MGTFDLVVVNILRESIPWSVMVLAFRMGRLHVDNLHMIVGIAND